VTEPDPSPTDAELRGVLEDADGRPIAGARLHLEGGADEVRTGPDGGFRLRETAAGSGRSLLVEVRGGEVRVAVPAEPVERLRVVGVPADAIPVRVLTPATAPVPTRYGWQALRRTDEGLESGPFGTATVPRFAVRGLAPGTWALVVWGGPFLPAVAEPIVLDGRTTPPLVTVEVSRRGASVAGRVLSPAGQPRSGARVEARPRDASLGLQSLRTVCTSDAGGRWRLEGLPPGRYDLIADAGGTTTETALSLLDREERAADLVVG
jgi:hypothetical protein